MGGGGCVYRQPTDRILTTLRLHLKTTAPGPWGVFAVATSWVCNNDDSLVNIPIFSENIYPAFLELSMNQRSSMRKRSQPWDSSFQKYG